MHGSIYSLVIGIESHHYRFGNKSNPKLGELEEKIHFHLQIEKGVDELPAITMNSGNRQQPKRQ